MSQSSGSESSEAKQPFVGPVIPIVQETLKQLALSLPQFLTYHAITHTEEVISEVTAFAQADHLSERSIHLLQVAAAFHDAGFVEGRAGHEERGAARAGEAMRRDGGYSLDEVAVVERLIRDTKLVFSGGTLQQIPSSPLSGYLLDADLGNLGRPDFFDKVELERQEMPVTSEVEFWSKLLLLISSKQWYTPAAKRLREAQWQENLAAVERRCARELRG